MLTEQRTCGFGRLTLELPQCDMPATRKQGTAYYCEKHARFVQMRRTAKERGKSVPEYRQLELLLPPDMRCPKCSVEMVWRVGRYESRKLVISLQHYNDGTIALECMGCNQLHGTIKIHIDEHAEPPQAEKTCPGCERLLPVGDFYKNSRSRTGASVYCRVCQLARYHARGDEARAVNAAYREANREILRERRRVRIAADPEAYREYQRAYRAANREKFVEYYRTYEAKKKAAKEASQC